MEMKTLIAITSCVRDAQNGSNQAMRDTFLKDIGKYPGLEYRFFIGDGTPTGENENHIRAGVKGCVDHNRGIDYDAKCSESEQNTKISSYAPKSDEVMLSVPDDYFHLVYKVREMHQWAQARST